MEHHIHSLRTQKFVISVLDGLCTASLAAFIDNQPQLKDCCEYFVQLTSTVKGSLLRAIVNSNNHVTLLCKVLARLLNHLGSAQAMQQLTSEVVEAVRVLGLSLNTVCTGFEGDDDTEESAMKISSALEASGIWQSLAAALAITAATLAQQPWTASGSTQGYDFNLNKPLILLGRTLLSCWINFQPSAMPLAVTKYAPTIMPAADLASQLLKACSLGASSSGLLRLLPQQATAMILECCADAAHFLTVDVIWQALKSDFQHFHEQAAQLSANQHVQKLLLLDLAIAVTRLHAQRQGISPVVVRLCEVTSMSKSKESVPVQAYSRELLVALGVPEPCIDKLCSVYQDSPCECIRLALTATSEQLQKQLQCCMERAASSANVHMYAAAQRAPLPLIELFLTVVQLAALQPEKIHSKWVKVVSQVVSLASSIVTVLLNNLKAGETQTSVDITHRQYLSQAVTPRLLDAVFDVLLPTVMVARHRCRRGLQQPETEPTHVAADVELIGQVGFVMISISAAVSAAPHQVLAKKILQQDPNAAVFALEAGVRYLATAASSFVGSDLTMCIMHHLCGEVYCTAMVGKRIPVAAAIEAECEKQWQRVSRRLCSLLMTCNKCAGLHPLDSVARCNIVKGLGMLTVSCGKLVQDMLYRDTSGSSSSVSVIPVEWLVMMARGTRLMGLGFCKPSGQQNDAAWTADAMDFQLDSVLEHLSYLWQQLEILLQPSVDYPAGLITDRVLRTLQQRYEEILQSAEQFVCCLPKQPSAISSNRSHTCSGSEASRSDADEYASRSSKLGKMMMMCLASEICAALPSRSCCNNTNCINFGTWSE